MPASTCSLPRRSTAIIEVTQATANNDPTANWDNLPIGIYELRELAANDGVTTDEWWVMVSNFQWTGGPEDPTHPRAEALATSSVANAIVLDGTYQIVRTDDADAVLVGNLREIRYTSIRGTRIDTLYPEELANTVVIEWTLRDARDPTKVLGSGEASGTSQLFVSANLQTARNNALPEALDRASEALVSRLANGY